MTLKRQQMDWTEFKNTECWGWSPGEGRTQISCLTTSSLPWFMDLKFQVPMQYCSLYAPMHLITLCVLWLVFTAFSSIAISAVTHADSRASLASLDSNPSTTEKSSEKTDNCEKVWLPSRPSQARYKSAVSSSSSSSSILVVSFIPRSQDPCLW